MKKYLEILKNRQLVGKWAKANMIRVAMAALLTMGVCVDVNAESHKIVLTPEQIHALDAGGEDGIYLPGTSNNTSFIWSTGSQMLFIIGSQGSQIGSENVLNESSFILGGGENKLGTTTQSNYSTIINGMYNNINTSNATVIGSSYVTLDYKNGYESVRNAFIGVNTATVKGVFNAMMSSRNITSTGNYVTVIGTKQAAINGDNNLVLNSDNSTVTGNHTAVIAGLNSTVSKDYGLAFGANTTVSVEGGVALGKGAVANTAAGEAGYDPSTQAASTNESATWKSTLGAVSVGSGEAGSAATATRQITGVAAGTQDTDAVNVAQLKAVVASAKGTTYETAAVSNGFQIKETDSKDAEGNTVTGASIGNVVGGTGVTITATEATETTPATYTISVDAGALNDTVTTVEGDGLVSVDDTGTDGNHNYVVSVSADDINSIVQNSEYIKNITNNIDESQQSMSEQGDQITQNTQNITTNTQNITKLQNDLATETSERQAEDERLDKRIDSLEKNTDARINKLDSRINKVGARAAALAALHPLEFDPDDKLTFAAGYGNYRGENAAAIGAFYRPDEKVMFSVGATVSDEENMINAGVSFSLDRTPRNTNSKTAMAKEILELRDQVAELKAMVYQLAGAKMQDATMFPDVPANHWAYEYVEDLQKRGIIEGYPDGNFSGDRRMSRYEFAAMLDRALKAGQILPDALTREFAPELGRIRVDRISGEDNDRHKVERIRVNGQKDQSRDVYGNKIVPVNAAK